MKTLFLALTVAVALATSAAAADRDTLQRELVRTETEFFQHARAHGFNAALHTYMAPDGFIANSLTLGRDVLAQRLAAESKPKAAAGIIRWRPLRAEVAESGELGYTWGIAEAGPGEGGPFKPYGIYVTIWRRQSDGKWRFVYDASTNLNAERIEAFVRERFPDAATVGPVEKPAGTR